jgi:galactokinase
MGSHTDYNEGYVLTMAIDRNTWLAARPRPDRRVVIHSLNFEGGGAFSLDAIARDPAWPWTNYVRGVAAALQAQGFPLHGFDGLIHSTIPFGSGLSSSAALEVATAVMFKMLAGNPPLNPVQLARLCQQAENQFVGVNSGILDQYSSALGQAGHALLLDCRHLTHQTASLPAGLQVVICDTRAKRELTGSEYGERRAQCEAGARQLGVEALRDVLPAQFEAGQTQLPEVVARRCRFIIDENQRVLDLAAALSGNDLATVGALTAASYAGARDLYEIGAPAMETMMQAMRGGPGVVGARQAGAGFGGCMVAFVAREAVPAFTAHVKTAYQAAAGLEPAVYPVQAAVGAGPLSL